MSITTYVEGLRAKPMHIRQRAAFWWAFGVTAVIFVFWLASFDFGKSAIKTSAASVAQSVSSPGESLVAGVGALGESIWTRIVGPKKVTYSEVIVTPGDK